MAGRSDGYGFSGREMPSYGFKTGEPWAYDRRALERAFREQDEQSGRSHRTSENARSTHEWSRTRTGSDFEGGGTMTTVGSISSSGSRGSAAYLYQHAGGANYGEALSVSSGAHRERTTSEHEFATGIFYPREGESGWVAGGYFYANHRSGHDEDEDVSSRCWSGDDRDDHDHRPTWRDLSEANDDPHSRWNGDSDGDDDWEDNHQGDGSADFQGMFDQERLFGFSEYPEHVGVYHEYDGEYEYDIDSEGDYYEDDDYDIGSGSEVFELESEYGFEYFEYLVGSSGDEESNASESDVGSCDIYYSDSD